MKILINENNIEKIAGVINDNQKNAKVRKLLVMDIYDAADYIVKQFDLPKKYIDNIVIWCDIYAQDFPKAYFKNSYVKPESTQFEITFSKGKAYLTDVYRTDVKKVKYTIKLNEIVKEKLIENFIKNI